MKRTRFSTQPGNFGARQLAGEGTPDLAGTPSLGRVSLHLPGSAPGLRRSRASAMQCPDVASVADSGFFSYRLFPKSRSKAERHFHSKLTSSS